MYHRRFDFVEVLERADRLHDDGARLLLANTFVLLEMEVEVVAFAVLEHRAEPAASETHHVNTRRVDTRRLHGRTCTATDTVNTTNTDQQAVLLLQYTIVEISYRVLM